MLHASAVGLPGLLHGRRAIHQPRTLLWDFRVFTLCALVWTCGSTPSWGIDAGTVGANVALQAPARPMH
eukprot:12707591-Alexandrium_andersonii.AAC.1